MDAKECPDAKALVLHSPHPFGGLQGGPWRCNGYGGTVASPEPQPLLGDCGDRDQHPEHDWTEDEGPAGREGRTLRCLGWPVPAWGRGSESEDVRTIRKRPTAKRGHENCACQRDLFAEWEDDDPSALAHGSGTVPGDPKEGKMSSTASVRIADAKKALNVLSAQHTPQQTPKGDEDYNHAMTALAVIIRDYEADSQALEQSNALIGQRADECSKHQAEAAEKLAEAERQRVAAMNRNQPLMLEAQRLRVEIQQAKKQIQILEANVVPISDEIGALLLDVRESVQWLNDLAAAKPGSPIPQDNFSKVASKVSQLEAHARKLVANHDILQRNHTDLSRQFGRSNQQHRDLHQELVDAKKTIRRLRKLAKAKPVPPIELESAEETLTCKVCYGEVKPDRFKRHRRYHKAMQDQHDFLHNRVSHVQADTRNQAEKRLLQDDRSFGDMGR